jgi:undecaprenyl-diphosphatase
MALKFMLRRPRPEGTWGQVYRRTDPHSFPSGHAARVAMFATLGFLITPPWVGVTFVVWGLLVVISRVALGVHYFADVVVGLGVGVVFGFLTYSLNLLLPFSSILPMLAGG